MSIEAEQRELRCRPRSGRVIALLLAAGVGGWLVGSPDAAAADRLAAQAAAITERDPSRAPPQPPHPDDELGRLARAFNDLLDRLATALHSQRQFMADASHELRTPVSVVRTTAQVTLSQPARPEHEYRESLRASSQNSPAGWRGSSTRCSCCRAPRRRAFRLMREPLYLDDWSPSPPGRCACLPRSAASTIDTHGDDGGDVLRRQDVAAADDWQPARQRDSPRAGWVASSRLRSRARPMRYLVRITDDGDGIAPEHQGRIFERFVRFDGRSQGAGLGLPIARWIAEAHGGTPQRSSRLAREGPASPFGCPLLEPLSSSVHLAR